MVFPHFRHDQGSTRTLETPRDGNSLTIDQVNEVNEVNEVGEEQGSSQDGSPSSAVNRVEATDDSMEEQLDSKIRDLQDKTRPEDQEVQAAAQPIEEKEGSHTARVHRQLEMDMNDPPRARPASSPRTPRR